MNPNNIIKHISPGRKFRMGEMGIRQPLPSDIIQYIDPFILLHHGEVDYEAEEDLKKMGVGPHPHRGFSPVTFMYDGCIHHRDSRGNDSVVCAGGVQWMHAGMGIEHSERPASKRMEFIQLWINTPQVSKMLLPTYQPFNKQDIPTTRLGKGSQISVVSGNVLGMNGPVKTLHPVHTAMVRGCQEDVLSWQIEEGHNACLYILNGVIMIGQEEIPGKNLIVLHTTDSLSMTIIEDAQMLYFSGQPLDEPIVAQGPFVMNNEIEIMEAYRDYKMGKMGVLIEE